MLRKSVAMTLHPYASDGIWARDVEIKETAMHREILQIYRKASEKTKAVYELARDTDGVEEENWIIRWLLWHAFRYRDQRNNRKSRSGSKMSLSGDEDGLSSNADIQSTPDLTLPSRDGGTADSHAGKVQGKSTTAAPAVPKTDLRFLQLLNPLVVFGIQYEVHGKMRKIDIGP